MEIKVHYVHIKSMNPPAESSMRNDHNYEIDDSHICSYVEIGNEEEAGSNDMANIQQACDSKVLFG